MKVRREALSHPVQHLPTPVLASLATLKTIDPDSHGERQPPVDNLRGNARISGG
jgi:hypothetical protein